MTWQWRERVFLFAAGALVGAVVIGLGWLWWSGRVATDRAAWEAEARAALEASADSARKADSAEAAAERAHEAAERLKAIRIAQRAGLDSARRVNDSLMASLARLSVDIPASQRAPYVEAIGSLSRLAAAERRRGDSLEVEVALREVQVGGLSRALAAQRAATETIRVFLADTARAGRRRVKVALALELTSGPALLVSDRGKVEKGMGVQVTVVRVRFGR